MHCDHPDGEERAWAHGSLAELWLIRLADADVNDDEERRAEFGERGVPSCAGTGALVSVALDEFPVKSTRRQFARYVDWWGRPRFEQDLAAHGLRAAERDGEASSG